MQNKVTIALSFEQNKVYRLATQGVKAIDGKKKLTNEEFQKINSQCKSNQNLINRYKQQEMIKQTNGLFKMFFHSKSAQEIVEQKKTDDSFFCQLSMKDLGIANKGLYSRDYIDFLIEQKVLPSNFYTI